MCAISPGPPKREQEEDTPPQFMVQPNKHKRKVQRRQAMRRVSSVELIIPFGQLPKTYVWMMRQAKQERANFKLNHPQTRILS